MDSSSIEHWRKYFRTAGGDIFEVIENAITVAALDFPKDFRIKRDQIAEKLFLSQLNRCAGCHGVELAVTKKNNADEGTKFRGGGNCESIEVKERKVDSSRNDNRDLSLNYTSTYSYHEAEALTEEIEEQSQTFGEVMRIKELLSKSDDQSEDTVIESLRRLQLMSLSVETLQATKIGMTVNHLRKHKSKCISNLARTLVKEWKNLVEQWFTVKPAIKGGEDSPDSVNPSVVEEGLPSPPLDEGAFLATQTTSIELSRFFEGMDDDGNLRGCDDYMDCENERKPTSQNQRFPMRKIQPPHDTSLMRRKDSENRQTDIVKTNVVQVRPPKPIARHKAGEETKLQRGPDTFPGQKMTLSSQQDKSNCLNGEADQMKLEAAKRKLHNGYQEAENAKKQRTIQVMELHEIPRQGHGPVNSRNRSGSHHQKLSSCRR